MIDPEDEALDVLEKYGKSKNLKDVETAIRELEKLYNRLPGSPVLARYLANMLVIHISMLKNDKNKVMDDLSIIRKLAEKFPSNVIIGERLINALTDTIAFFGRDNVKETINWLEEASQIASRDATMLNYAAAWAECAANAIQVLVETGNIETAEKVIQKIREIAERWSAPAVLVPCTAAYLHLILGYNDILAESPLSPEWHSTFNHILSLLSSLKKLAQKCSTTDSYVFLSMAITQTIYNAGRKNDESLLSALWNDLYSLYSNLPVLREEKLFIKTIKLACNYIMNLSKNNELKRNAKKLQNMLK